MDLTDKGIAKAYGNRILFLTTDSDKCQLVISKVLFQSPVLFKKESNVLEKRIHFLPKAASFMEMLS